MEQKEINIIKNALIDATKYHKNESENLNNSVSVRSNHWNIGITYDLLKVKYEKKEERLLKKLCGGLL